MNGNETAKHVAPDGPREPHTNPLWLRAAWLAHHGLRHYPAQPRQQVTR